MTLHTRPSSWLPTGRARPNGRYSWAGRVPGHARAHTHTHTPHTCARSTQHTPTRTHTRACAYIPHAHTPPSLSHAHANTPHAQLCHANVAAPPSARAGLAELEPRSAHPSRTTSRGRCPLPGEARVCGRRSSRAPRGARAGAGPRRHPGTDQSGAARQKYDVSHIQNLQLSRTYILESLFKVKFLIVYFYLTQYIQNILTATRTPCKADQRDSFYPSSLWCP